MTHLIVPGIGGSGPTHWQTLWERDLEQSVRIAPTSWDEPRLDDWLAALDRASESAGPDAVIVAHSLGCLAVAEWLARNPGGASAVLLVAPPDPDGEHYPEQAREFARDGVRPLGLPALVVASDDDPYGSRAFAAELAERLGAGFVSVGPLGHINAASDLGDWQEGRELLDDLVEVAQRTAA
ncbi:RBBP9/YdeN family alpha/beta hydrolase [Agromyces allii]|uniref:Alpha/beta hydrolase n=1 Tax=Agromyces allii TaxID=393607 RepID=A0ABN2QA89_9MICO|nr:alpha/beta hydrolase [Agromyces allii]